MTTRITFLKGPDYILPDGNFINRTGDRRLGGLLIEDNLRLEFAAIRVGVFTLDVAAEGCPVTREDLLKIDPDLKTEVQEVWYLGKEKLR